MQREYQAFGELKIRQGIVRWWRFHLGKWLGVGCYSVIGEVAPKGFLQRIVEKFYCFCDVALVIPSAGLGFAKKIWSAHLDATLLFFANLFRRLKHPNVVSTFGIHKDPQDQLWLVMELGESNLRQLVQMTFRNFKISGCNNITWI